MKKNGLTLAVTAGLAMVGGVADAVHINPDGTGQVLIYPYYTVQDGNQTAISVVNTADIGKAVKVRFLEGRNSRETLDFNLYLSPYDVWTGTLFAPEGFNAAGAGLITRDNSCTVPDIRRGGFGLAIQGGPTEDTSTADLGEVGGVYYAGTRAYEYMVDSVSPGDPADPADVSARLPRSREGYAEIILMGDIDPSSDTHDWALHDSTGEPGDCEAIVMAWAAAIGGGGYASPDENGGDIIPNEGDGGLFGNAFIVNPGAGTLYSYTADAIDSFSFSANHTQPGSINPSLREVEDTPGATEATANVFVAGNLVSATYDDATGAGKLDAVSALFATRRVVNEYYLDAEAHVSVVSEWVLTFPTKRFYVDDDPTYDAFNSSGGYVGPAIAAGAPYAPFTNAFENGACEDASVTVFDREEKTPTSAVCDTFPRPPACDFSPVRPRPGERQGLCWESQVITFNQADNVAPGASTAILGGTYAQNIASPYAHGWARINFPSQSMRPSDDAGAVVFHGLPVTGFFVTRVDNGVLADAGGVDVLANYGGLFHHRARRECTGAGCS